MCTFIKRISVFLQTSCNFFPVFFFHFVVVALSAAVLCLVAEQNISVLQYACWLLFFLSLKKTDERLMDINVQKI